jgi:hypothetical protein
MAQRTFTVLGIEVELTRLIPDIQSLLLWGLLESLSVDQLVIVALVLLLAAVRREPKAPSSCR